MYQLLKDVYTGEIVGVYNKEMDASIPFDERNGDYRQYLKWVEEGNTPEPADE